MNEQQLAAAIERLIGRLEAAMAARGMTQDELARRIPDLPA